MPIIKDEYSDHSNSGGMSKAELRKSNKPIMEKRRRARINNCLNELKSLILEAMRKDPARHSKLEKADILEMTVKHLQNVQRQQLSVAVASDPTVLQKFKSGFGDCVKSRLLNHLNSCVSGLQQVTPFSLPSSTTAPPPPVTLPPAPSLLEDVNNNEASARLQMISSGIQVIPSRLPTGELALLLSGSSGLFSSPPEVSSSESSSSDRVSAFSVVEHKKPKSPPPSPTSSTDGDVVYLSPHNAEVTSTSTTQDNVFKVPSLQTKAFSSKPSYFSPYTNESSLLMKVPPYHQAEPCSSSVIYRPLITTLNKPQETKRPGFSIEVDDLHEDDKKKPIDFSMKKLVTTGKTPLSDLPCNVPLLKASPKVPNDGENNVPPISKATTSSSESSQNRDMWRPW
ncbi:hypothetical protein M8J76_002116 [Diaphorina citri]|nr:hypothetical protein M8J75_014189 [Diaphorina citri]KAI5744422.1 hypothetical protein M8J76_002116 [Diaphorina citri]